MVLARETETTHRQLESIPNNPTEIKRVTIPLYLEHTKRQTHKFGNRKQ